MEPQSASFYGHTWECCWRCSFESVTLLLRETSLYSKERQRYTVVTSASQYIISSYHAATDSFGYRTQGLLIVSGPKRCSEDMAAWWLGDQTSSSWLAGIVHLPFAWGPKNFTANPRINVAQHCMHPARINGCEWSLIHKKWMWTRWICCAIRECQRDQCKHLSSTHTYAFIIAFIYLRVCAVHLLTNKQTMRFLRLRCESV
jgi:hypothetical protein